MLKDHPEGRSHADQEHAGRKKHRKTTTTPTRAGKGSAPKPRRLLALPIPLNPTRLGRKRLTPNNRPGRSLRRINWPWPRRTARKIRGRAGQEANRNRDAWTTRKADTGQSARPTPGVRRDTHRPEDRAGAKIPACTATPPRQPDPERRADNSRQEKIRTDTCNRKTATL